MTQASQRIVAPVVSPTTGALIIPPVEPGSLPGAFGRKYNESSAQEIQDATRELQNKIAWVLGTFYHIPYSTKRSPVYPYVSKCVTAILRDHGYPI